MKLRKAKNADAGAMSRLAKITISRLNKPFYNGRQIWALKHSISATGYRKMISSGGRFILAAEDEGSVIGQGILNLEKKMISGMYVSCGQVRRGIGGKIVSALEKRAKEKGIKKLALNSSLSAVGFYQKNGYQPIKKTIILIYGEKIPCIFMNKKI